MKQAANTVQSPMRRKIGNALQNVGSDTALSSGFGAFAPINTLSMASRGLGRVISGDATSDMQKLAELLEQPVNALRAQGVPEEEIVKLENAFYELSIPKSQVSSKSSVNPAR